MNLQTLHALTARLLASGLNPTTEVMIVHQKKWPLREHLGGVATPADLEAHARDKYGAEFDDYLPPGKPRVYLVSDGVPTDESPYATEACWEVAQRS